jgi:hypothetical protein
MKINDINNFDAVKGLDVVTSDVNNKEVKRVKVQNYDTNDDSVTTVIAAVEFTDGSNASEVEMWKKPFKGAVDSILEKSTDAKGNVTFVPKAGKTVRFINIAGGVSTLTDKPAGGAKTFSSTRETVVA